MAQISLQELTRWAVQTPSDPRGVLRRFIALGWSPAALIQALLAITILGVIVSHLVMLVLPPASNGEQGLILTAGPLASFALQAAMTLSIVALTHIVARAFGGTGTLRETLAAVLWLQFVLLFVQFAQAILLLVLPSVGLIVFMVSFGLLFYLLVNFICEIHGFTNVGLVFLSMLGVLFALSMVLATVLVSLGYVPALEPTNV